jgi:hypothetical protein
VGGAFVVQEIIIGTNVIYTRYEPVHLAEASDIEIALKGLGLQAPERDCNLESVYISHLV